MTLVCTVERVNLKESELPPLYCKIDKHMELVYFVDRYKLCEQGKRTQKKKEFEFW